MAAHKCGHRNPVRPTLIFLNLLKADAEEFPQLPLAHAERLASGAQAAPHDDIHGIMTILAFSGAGLGSAVADR